MVNEKMRYRSGSWKTWTKVKNSRLARRRGQLMGPSDQPVMFLRLTRLQSSARTKHSLCRHAL